MILSEVAIPLSTTRWLLSFSRWRSDDRKRFSPGANFFHSPEIAQLKVLNGALPNCMLWTRETGAQLSVQVTDLQFRGLNR